MRTSYSSSLYRLLDSLFRRIWLLVALVILSTAVVVLAVTFLLKGYTASKVLLVTQPQVTQIVYGRDGKALKSEDKTQALDALIHSRTLLEEAAQRAGIALGASPEAKLKTLQRLRKGLKAEVDTKSSFIVSLRWPRRAEAEKTVDAIVDLYIRYMSQAQAAESITAAAFLEGQLGEYKQKMQAAEAKRRTFREANLQNLPSMQNSYVGKLQELDQSLVDVRIQAEENRMRLAQLKQRLAGVPKMIEAELTSGPNPLEAELTRLKTEEIRLLGTLTPEHPDVLAVREQIKVAEQRLRESKDGVTERKMMINPTYSALDGQLQDAEVTLKTLASRETALRQALASYEQRVSAIPKQEQQLAALERDFKVYQTAFEDLTQKLANARIQKELALRRYQDMYLALDSAEALPTLTPVKRAVLFAFGPLFGLFVGLMLILALEAGDRSYRTVAELNADLDLPVLATVPNTPGMQELTAGLAALSAGAPALSDGTAASDEIAGRDE